MIRFGAPPENLWPYDVTRLDEEPSAILFSYAREFQPIAYARLDPPGIQATDTLATVKAFLAAGFPCAFGFPVCSCVSRGPDLSFPTAGDSVRGGQAVLAVGFDDRRVIRSHRGALRIRNSWGPDWGDGGYGWLPYEYVLKQLAADFWTLLEPSWLGGGEFRRPATSRKPARAARRKATGEDDGSD